MPECSTSPKFPRVTLTINHTQVHNQRQKLCLDVFHLTFLLLCILYACVWGWEVYRLGNERSSQQQRYDQQTCHGFMRHTPIVLLSIRVPSYCTSQTLINIRGLHERPNLPPRHSLKAPSLLHSALSCCSPIPSWLSLGILHMPAHIHLAPFLGFQDRSEEGS